MWSRAAIVIVLLIFVFTQSVPYYTQSAEAAFSSTKNLSKSSGFSSDPKIAVSGSNVYVVWEDFTPGNWNILFRASTDNGASFGNIVNVSNTAEESGRAQIAVSDSNVYVVWQDFTARKFDILFRASTDNGASFGNTVKLNNDAGFLSDPRRSDPPQIAVSGSSIYVVWVDSGEVFFTGSKDNGASFSSAIELSNNAAFNGVFFRPQIAVSGSSIYVVWVDSGEVFFTGSKDNGASFSSTFNLSTASKNATAPKRSDLPDIAVSGSSVYVVWVDYIPGNYDIFLRASKDNGASFSSAIELTKIAALSDLPHIAVSGSNVYVMWVDFNLGHGLDMFFRASKDNGATFGSAVNLSRNIAFAALPPIAVSGSNVYVVSSVGNYDIFFMASKDNGSTFSSAVNLSNNIGDSSDPHMAVSGDNAYVVWEDYAPGNPDIFFRAFVQNGLAAETMVLPTENGSINVEVTIDRETLEPEEPVRFTLRFLHPTTGELLQNVNYSFMITDENGSNVLNKENLYTHEGVDRQSVTFSNTGSFSLTIDVAGLGINKPFDTMHGGMASTALIVVPEFPVSILAIMAIVVGTGIAITRFRNPVLRQ
ncbi:MAG: sialidase family protein [Nitrososphaerales archaeon]